jgi:hypothetical protein
METLMLHLSDLCVLCGKTLETTIRAWRQAVGTVYETDPDMGENLESKRIRRLGCTR